MAKRDLLVLIIALVCGFLSFVLILSFLSDAGRPKNAIVVAAVDIEEGKEISRGDVVYSDSLELENKEDYFLLISDVVGRVALEDISSGDFILRTSTKAKEVVVEVTKEVIKEVEPVKEEVITELPVPPGNTGLLLKQSNFSNLDQNVRLGQFMDMIQLKPRGDTKIPVGVAHNAKVLRIDRNPLTEKIQGVFVGVHPEEMPRILGAVDEGPLMTTVHDQPHEVEQKTVHEVEIIKGDKKPYKVKFDLQQSDHYE